jgi:triosephosphate isomerase
LKQITKGLKNINKSNNILLAYEPTWSIGTGVIPKIDDLKKDIMFIKKNLNKMFKNDNVKILYGGSVNSNNILDLKKINDIDGFLIGGASQSPNKFIDIIKKTFN